MKMKKKKRKKGKETGNDSKGEKKRRRKHAKRSRKEKEKKKTVGRVVWNVIDVIIIIIDSYYIPPSSSSFYVRFVSPCVSLSTDKNRNREEECSSSFELATQVIRRLVLSGNKMKKKKAKRNEERKRGPCLIIRTAIKENDQTLYVCVCVCVCVVLLGPTKQVLDKTHTHTQSTSGRDCGKFGSISPLFNGQN